MAEEVKQEEKKTDVKKIFGTLLKVVLGLVFLGLGVALWWAWRGDFLAVLKGCLGPFLVLAGVITLAIAKE